MAIPTWTRAIASSTKERRRRMRRIIESAVEKAGKRGKKEKGYEGTYGKSTAGTFRQSRCGGGGGTNPPRDAITFLALCLPTTIIAVEKRQNNELILR